MKATDQFKMYLNDIINEVDPKIHESLWDKLVICISENIDKETKVDSEKKELIECIQNLMGCFDNPLARRQLSNSFSEEARKIGREVLIKHTENNS